MIKVDLYRYEDTNGAVAITPNKRNDADIPCRIRLIADEGYVLTNGVDEAAAIDVILDEVGLWSENVTEADYINALEELGVNFNE